MVSDVEAFLANVGHETGGLVYINEINAISAVRRIRATAARPALEHLLDHEQDTIRRRAQEALSRLP